jgi:hypothetical protein
MRGPGFTFLAAVSMKSAAWGASRFAGLPAPLASGATAPIGSASSAAVALAGRRERSVTTSPSDAGTEREVRQFNLDDLYLDPKNPRLPESVQNTSQENILQYVRENGELTELARSFADNGYFVQEPVLLVRRKGKGFTVVEGNRRVSTLKLLQQDPPPFIDVELTPARKGELALVPGVVLGSEDDLHRYVGFRHISGLQPWSPEAKARYLYLEVEKERLSDDDPFRVVARRVGLQPAQVRQAYLAYAILRFAADNLSLDVGGVVDHAKRRFGVWLRAVESPGIRKFIGVDSPTTYREVVSALEQLRKVPARLREVVNDIAPPKGLPILEDSREVTLYARILENAEALKAKREDRSLESAREIVGREAFVGRVLKVEKTLDALSRELSAFEEAPEDGVVDAVESVRRAAVRLSGTVKALAAEKEP